MTSASPLVLSPCARGVTVWFTGLPGAGKTTLCEHVTRRLQRCRVASHVLDGDLVRQQLWPDLGYAANDRRENVSRLILLAQQLAIHSGVVLVAAIAPYRASRLQARRQLGRFLEVYVNAPVEVCRHRDPKGLYARAEAGLLHGVTGVDAPYEIPETPDVECRTDQESITESCDKVMKALLPEIGLPPQ